MFQVKIKKKTGNMRMPKKKKSDFYQKNAIYRNMMYGKTQSVSFSAMVANFLMWRLTIQKYILTTFRGFP